MQSTSVSPSKRMYKEIWYNISSGIFLIHKNEWNLIMYSLIGKNGSIHVRLNKLDTELRNVYLVSYVENNTIINPIEM